MSVLDHGVLNVSLAYRGDTLFGVSRREFEKRQKAAARAERQATHAARIEARRLISLVSDVRMAELGAAVGLTAKQARAKWRSIAVSMPQTVVKALAREVQP